MEYKSEERYLGTHARDIAERFDVANKVGFFGILLGRESKFSEVELITNGYWDERLGQHSTVVSISAPSKEVYEDIRDNVVLPVVQRNGLNLNLAFEF